MTQQGLEDYAALHQWSINDSPAFWQALCECCEIRFDRPARTVLTRPENIMDAGWFDGAKLNFAAHLLRHTGDEAAIIFCGENDAPPDITRAELRSSVRRVTSALPPSCRLCLPRPGSVVAARRSVRELPRSWRGGIQPSSIV